MDNQINYTQHSVAFPTLRLDGSTYDELNIGYVKANGEFNIAFMKFSGGHRGVQVQYFGDALDIVNDKRIKQVLAKWATMEQPDNALPTDFIRWLEEIGAVPSRYHSKQEED